MAVKQKLGYLDLKMRHIFESFDRLPSQRLRLRSETFLHDSSLIVICVVRVMLCNPIISVFQRERCAVRSLCKDTSN